MGFKDKFKKAIKEYQVESARNRAAQKIISDKAKAAALRQRQIEAIKYAEQKEKLIYKQRLKQDELRFKARMTAQEKPVAANIGYDFKPSYNYSWMGNSAPAKPSVKKRIAKKKKKSSGKPKYIFKGGKAYQVA